MSSPAILVTESSTAAVSNWSPALLPGPYWPSFEQFRQGGSSALDSVPSGAVGTLHCKAGTFRILRDHDFQKLVGLASEVHRLKCGITFAVKAAKVVAKHPGDRESMELLIHSVSMLSESNLLPQRDGHDKFAVSAEEKALYGGEDLDINTLEIPRPKLDAGDNT